MGSRNVEPEWGDEMWSLKGEDVGGRILSRIGCRLFPQQRSTRTKPTQDEQGAFLKPQSPLLYALQVVLYMRTKLSGWLEINNPPGVGIR